MHIWHTFDTHFIHTWNIGSPFATPEPTTSPSEPQESTGPPSRQFVCVCWELDPHLLLLTTVSGQFNPHINWLLETLGFEHARTTIPKWIQRGAMDPLDMVISRILELVVKLTASKKLQMNTASLAKIDESWFFLPLISVAFVELL